MEVTDSSQNRSLGKRATRFVAGVVDWVCKCARPVNGGASRRSAAQRTAHCGFRVAHLAQLARAGTPLGLARRLRGSACVPAPPGCTAGVACGLHAPLFLSARMRLLHVPPAAGA
jgi:hypothetical protein